MKGFWKKLVEALTVKLSVEIIFAVVFLALGYFNRGVILNLLSYQLPIWVTITATFSLLFLVGIAPVLNSSRKERGKSANVFPIRPEHPKYVFDVDMFGVKWKVRYGSYEPFSEPYAFAEGPLCPKCVFEMDSEKRGIFIKKDYWKCVPCNKFYKNPEKSWYEAKRAVEKYVESDIRSGRFEIG